MQTTESLKGSSKNSDNGSMHETNAKYSVMYHGGLEVVDQHNAPEAVDSTTNLNRKSSLLQPELYGAAPYYSDKKDHRSDYQAPHALSPEYEGLQYHEQHDGLQYYDQNDDKRPVVGALEIPSTKTRRRCCGIQRRLFIIIMVVVAIILVIGILLGAVLGTLLPKKWAKESDDAGIQTWSGTGLASTLAGDGSGRLLTYFQDPDGRILENSYMDGTWTLEDRANEDLSVVTTQAAYGSQLAAISYRYDGKTYRQVFFTTSTGATLSANSTETMAGGIATNWSVARPITDDKVDPKGVGLAACWSTEAMNGIRAFYPSQYGYINEVSWTFGNHYWSDGYQIESSDPKSGVGCAVKNDNENEYLNLYYRNSRSGRVKQAWIDYLVHDPYYSYDSMDLNMCIRVP